MVQRWKFVLEKSNIAKITSSFLLESLDGCVLDVHVGVHPVPHQSLHDSVLRSSEVEISPELKKGEKMSIGEFS